MSVSGKLREQIEDDAERVGPMEPNPLPLAELGAMEVSRLLGIEVEAAQLRGEEGPLATVAAYSLEVGGLAFALVARIVGSMPAWSLTCTSADPPIPVRRPADLSQLLEQQTHGKE